MLVACFYRPIARMPMPHLLWVDNGRAWLAGQHRRINAGACSDAPHLLAKAAKLDPVTGYPMAATISSKFKQEK